MRSVNQLSQARLSCSAQSSSNHFNTNSLLIQQHMRMFSKKEEKTHEEAKAHKAEHAKIKEEVKEKQSEPQKKASTTKKQEETSSSSDEETASNLSHEDVKKIKSLIAEQDKEIETLKEQVKQYKEKLIY